MSSDVDMIEKVYILDVCLRREVEEGARVYPKFCNRSKKACVNHGLINVDDDATL